MTNDCKNCECIYTVRWDDDDTGYCDGCAQVRVSELEAREPLVLEVIELSKQLGLLHDRGAPEGIKMAALHSMHLAVRKLAEFSP